jgi:class 3 adenylate cyclase
MLATLNNLWVEYDAIARKYGVYKIETIGDAFLGVTGCPEKVPDHAERAANFSIGNLINNSYLDIMNMIKDFKTVMGESIQIRIGLNSGPVTAGLLGELNPHYCVVGDSVNVASKMESSSTPGRIHISEATNNLLKGHGFKTAPSDPVTLKVIFANALMINRVNNTIRFGWMDEREQ